MSDISLMCYQSVPTRSGRADYGQANFELQLGIGIRIG
jgi:hypothetical protein